MTAHRNIRNTRRLRLLGVVLVAAAAAAGLGTSPAAADVTTVSQR